LVFLLQEEYSRKTAESCYDFMLFESEDSKNKPKTSDTKDNHCQEDNKNSKTGGFRCKDVSNVNFIEIESDDSED